MIVIGDGYSTATTLKRKWINDDDDNNKNKATRRANAQTTHIQVQNYKCRVGHVS